MPKLKVSDLAKIKERVSQDTALRQGGARVKMTVHMGTCGIASGARDVLNALMDELEASGRQDIMVTTSGCAGLCSHEPMVTVQYGDQEPVKYVYLDEAKIRQIFHRHALEGEVQTQWALARSQEEH